MERMVQEYDNYPQRCLQESFTKFVIQFQDKYDFLEKTDPITLFYRVEDVISSKITLEDMVDGEMYLPRSQIILDKAKEMRNELIRQKDEEYANKKMKEHRYVDLLYRMRCRVSHEFSALHISFSQVINEPTYIKCSRQYMKKGQLASDGVWQLRFPISFVRDLCLNCFENYLEYCLKKHISPNKNNGLDRFCELSWYNR